MRRSFFASLLVVLAAVLTTTLGAPDVGAQASGEGEKKPPRRFVRVPAPDGVQIRRYNKTDGRQPTKNDRVVLHYHGTLEDGTVFDSTRKRRYPETFRMKKVVPCWQVALARLHVGEEARITCPPATAYGWEGKPPTIPPNSTLTFEVELLGVN